MGTITPEGAASVHCYKCDDEVIDNFLSEHLASFGIEVAQMKKTERTIAELELEKNLNFHLSKAVFKPALTELLHYWVEQINIYVVNAYNLLFWINRG